MATFVKKDDTTVTQVELRIVRPKPTNEGIIGYIENFEIDHRDVTMDKRCRMSIRITNLELAEASGFAPTVFVGAKVEIRLVS